MASKNIVEEDRVQWTYAGHPAQGTAAEIKDQPGEKVQIVSQKGNTITRNADEENPAVRIERRGEGNNNDVVKRMSELTKVGEGDKPEGEGDKTKEPAAGEKRAASEPTGETEAETTVAQEGAEKPKAKKAKTNPEMAKGGAGIAKASKRGRGRGHGRAAAGADNLRRKPPARSKKGSSNEAQDVDKEATVGESTAVDGTTDADAPGEPDSSSTDPRAQVID